MNNSKITFIKRNWLKFLISGVAIALVISSLYFVNMGIVNVEWNAQSSIEGFQINNATGEIKQTLYIYIDESSMYAGQIRSFLLQELDSAQTKVKQMMVLNDTSSIKDASFLGIHITENLNQYYPWSAENKYTVFYYYSDTGNTNYYNAFRTAISMYDHPPVVLNASNGPQLLRIGDITIEGAFNGFFSKPHMDKMSIDYLCQEIIKQVNQI